MPTSQRSSPGSAGAAGSSERAAAHNVFFGLFPDAATRAAIAAVAARIERELAPRGRWIKPWRYHLTLQFLGSFQPLPVGLIECARTAAARVRVAPFTLVLDRIGSFRRRNAVWWLGCSEPPAELDALWQSLDAELRRAGIPSRDAALVPHVTLLRDAAHALAPLPVPGVRWRVSEFRLIDSRLGAEAEYLAVGQWPLRETA
jgi:2'-5' RNA ligase